MQQNKEMEGSLRIWLMNVRECCVIPSSVNEGAPSSAPE
jgi:hypothetical protein